MKTSLRVAHDHVGGHEIDGHPEVGIGGRLRRRRWTRGRLRGCLPRFGR